ncbi:MAG: hypothetical protein FJ091_22185, partial [Deltaproteobacteria bacterium]|nr:hypothetical protein [Deltaproteobacteria bacterium]
GRLAQDEDKDVREQVAGNASTPAEVLGRLAQDEDWEVRMGVAGNASMPAEVLGRLAQDKDTDVRAAVAANAAMPAEVLGRLAQDKDKDVRRGVAGNASTPAEVLGRLAQDKEERVRAYVAGNASTPAEVLAGLLGPSWELAAWLVGDSTLPGAVAAWLRNAPLSNSAVEERLEALGRVEGVAVLRREYVGRLVAGSRTSVSRTVGLLFAEAGPAVLAKCQRSVWWIDRCAIAQNSATPPSVRQAYQRDPHPTVREALASVAAGAARSQDGRDTPVVEGVEPSRDWQAAFREALASWDTRLVEDVPSATRKAFQGMAFLLWRQSVREGLTEVPQMLLRHAARQRGPDAIDEALRQGLARNASTPAEVLGRLAQDKDKDVRAAVAGNASTPAEALGRLAQDEAEFVRGCVAGNAATPAEVLGRLAQALAEDVRKGVAGNATTPAEVLGRLAQDEDKDVREQVAGNASTPAEVLGRLAQDENEHTRRGVAGNASMPAEVLGRLAQDEHKDVRAAVAGNAAMPA